MSIKADRMVAGVLIGGLPAGCAVLPGHSIAIFAFGPPTDIDRLVNEEKGEHVRCFETFMELGTMHSSVDRRDFGRAGQVAQRVILRDALTVRLSKDPAGHVWEVYKHGRKVREESYTAENPEDLPMPTSKSHKPPERK